MSGITELIELLEQHGLLQAHYRNSKQIVAEAIKEYVQDQGVLLEKQVESALRTLKNRQPSAFTNAQVKKSSKPYYNPHIGRVGIKHIHLQEAILLTLEGERPEYGKTIKYDRSQSKVGYRKNLYRAIIFYRDEQVLKEYIRARLSEPKLQYTFRVAEEMFIQSR